MLERFDKVVKNWAYNVYYPELDSYESYLMSWDENLWEKKTGLFYSTFLGLLTALSEINEFSVTNFIDRISGSPMQTLSAEEMFEQNEILENCIKNLNPKFPVDHLQSDYTNIDNFYTFFQDSYSGPQNLLGTISHAFTLCRVYYVFLDEFSEFPIKIPYAFAYHIDYVAILILRDLCRWYSGITSTAQKRAKSANINIPKIKRGALNRNSVIEEFLERNDKGKFKHIKSTRGQGIIISKALEKRGTKLSPKRVSDILREFKKRHLSDKK